MTNRPNCTITFIHHYLSCLCIAAALTLSTFFLPLKMFVIHLLYKYPNMRGIITEVTCNKIIYFLHCFFYCLFRTSIHCLYSYQRHLYLHDLSG